jgi:hypothetical protein
MQLYMKDGVDTIAFDFCFRKLVQAHKYISIFRMLAHSFSHANLLAFEWFASLIHLPYQARQLSGCFFEIVHIFRIIRFIHSISPTTQFSYSLLSMDEENF